MKAVEDVQTWRGMKMVDADGDKIGTIEDIFLDRQTAEPAWAAVKTGLFGRKHTLVPIREAEVAQDDEIRVPFQKEQVKEAPNIDPDGELSPDDWTIRRAAMPIMGIDPMTSPQFLALFQEWTLTSSVSGETCMHGSSSTPVKNSSHNFPKA